MRLPDVLLHRRQGQATIARRLQCWLGERMTRRHLQVRHWPGRNRVPHASSCLEAVERSLMEARTRWPKIRAAASVIPGSATARPSAPMLPSRSIWRNVVRMWSATFFTKVSVTESPNWSEIFSMLRTPEYQSERESPLRCCSAIRRRSRPRNASWLRAGFAVAGRQS